MLHCSYLASGPHALVERLTRTTAPAKAVGGPLDADHADSVIFRRAARIPGDDDNIAGLQRFACHSLTAQLSGSTPLDRPANAFVIEDLNE